MSITKVHWPPMNKFACKLHGYIVYFVVVLASVLKSNNYLSFSSLFSFGLFTLLWLFIFSLPLSLLCALLCFSRMVEAGTGYGRQIEKQTG